jgi:large subunit ribosomal protein L30
MEKIKTNINEKMKIEDKNARILVIIRIKGNVKVRTDLSNTLDRLHLERKYSCTILDENNNTLKGMLKKIRYLIAYGPIDKITLIKLIEARAQYFDKKIKKLKSEEIAEEILNGKKLKDLGIKPFFRLHPPRKGIKSKLQYPKGVLGNNKEDINKLIERML